VAAVSMTPAPAVVDKSAAPLTSPRPQPRPVCEPFWGTYCFHKEATE
jgi:hypothetical protein